MRVSLGVPLVTPLHAVTLPPPVRRGPLLGRGAGGGAGPSGVLPRWAPLALGPHLRGPPELLQQLTRTLIWDTFSLVPRKSKLHFLQEKEIGS